MNYKRTYKENDSLTKVMRVMALLKTRETVATQEIASAYGVSNPFVIMWALKSLEVVVFTGRNHYAVNNNTGVTAQHIINLMRQKYNQNRKNYLTKKQPVMTDKRVGVCNVNIQVLLEENKRLKQAIKLLVG